MKLPSPPMLVSVAALVVALGGTSYAAAQINGANIKPKSIDSSSIKKNELGSSVIKDGKIKPKDLSKKVTTSISAGKTRWVQVGANGQVVSQSGGFTITSAYPDAPAAANGNVYLNAGEDLSDNGISATIQLQNTVDQNADAIANGTSATSDTNPEFSGEISVSRCNVGAAGSATATGPTNCAPAGTQTNTHFVVSPRLSDGTRTAADTRKPFFVVITAS